MIGWSKIVRFCTLLLINNFREQLPPRQFSTFVGAMDHRHQPGLIVGLSAFSESCMTSAPARRMIAFSQRYIPEYHILKYYRKADEGVYKCGIRRYPTDDFTFSDGINVHVNQPSKDIIYERQATENSQTELHDGACTCSSLEQETPVFQCKC